MSESPHLGLPTKKDWIWVLGLIVLGGALGFGLNALSPVGINLSIALDLDNPPPAPAASPTPAASPAAGSPHAQAKP